MNLLSTRAPKLARKAFFASACAALALSTTPGVAAADETKERAVATLRYDLERIVDSAESTGWKIDRYEMDGMMGDALQSICVVTPALRTAVLEDLEDRVRRLGGPIEAAFAKTGDIDELSDLLFATRARDLAAEAIRRAPRECPFWVRPTDDFRGMQTNAYKFDINLEGGGLFVVRLQNGELTPGGGGSGRLLLGRGLDEHWSLLVGPEFGTFALFEQGQSSTHFQISFLGAVPVVLRHQWYIWHYDLELAPIGYFNQSDTRLSWGGRAGVVLGISGLRIRRIVPWGGLGVAVEGVFPNSVREPFQNIKGGLRLGFDWDY